MPTPRFDHADYISTTMEFRCNLRCAHCMIEGTMDRLRPQSDEAFERLCAVNAAEGRWRGLVLTGAEITLRRDLPELARRARRSGFRHVRIQTHGMALEKPEFCAALIEAGVDEYFISICGSTAERHDAISGVPGSFDRLMRGLANLDRSGAVILTNTVITRRSVADLPRIVEVLAGVRNLAQMEFWNFWPMREDDPQDLVASLDELLPPLRRAAQRAQVLGRAVEIKNVPQCSLGSDMHLLANHQPQLLIDDAFWAEFARNGFYQCLYRDRCVATQCLGLGTAYIRKFGPEERTLHPIVSHPTHWVDSNEVGTLGQVNNRPADPIQMDKGGRIA